MSDGGESLRAGRAERPVHELNPPDTDFELANGWLVA
jgi:hypothetical protein